MIEWLKERKDYFRFDIIAGSIATKQAALDLQEWGVDGLRVGVGGGSVCETRIRTGAGVPQLQAVFDVAEVAKVPFISDGGIRYPGDAAKALAAGADSVMIGSLFAGTDEAPGEIFVAGKWPDIKLMKVYRGLASATTKLKNGGAASHVEGASKMVECRGTVTQMIQEIVDGITSSMSYVGASNLEEFRTRAEFVKITSSGLAEAHPHGVR
jgi:IMP dehydrogenase